MYRTEDVLRHCIRPLYRNCPCKSVFPSGRPLPNSFYDIRWYGICKNPSTYASLHKLRRPFLLLRFLDPYGHLWPGTVIHREKIVPMLEYLVLHVCIYCIRIFLALCVVEAHTNLDNRVCIISRLQILVLRLVERSSLLRVHLWMLLSTSRLCEYFKLFTYRWKSFLHFKITLTWPNAETNARHNIIRIVCSNDILWSHFYAFVMHNFVSSDSDWQLTLLLILFLVMLSPSRRLLACLATYASGSFIRS